MLRKHCVQAVFFVLLFAVLACGSSALKSRDVRFNLGDTDILIRESGAIIVGKRQVANLAPDGKVVDSYGKLIAVVHEDSIRLRGGAALEVKTESDGSLYVSKAAQEKANLKPILYRVRENGTLAQSEGAKGVEIEGLLTPIRRRLVLLILLMDANNLWPEEAGEDSVPGAGNIPGGSTPDEDSVPEEGSAPEEEGSAPEGE